MLKFTKMHGLGNDFLVVDLVRQTMPLSPALIARLAHRNFGIGFDQMLVVEPPSHPEVDFKYRIFNADGSEVSQCGNGARCFAVFVREQGLTRKQHMCVETASGVIELYVADNGWVRVNMGAPRFSPELIPFLPHNTEPKQHKYELEVADQRVQFAVVNMGNPHAVIQVDNVLTADVQRLGPLMESHTSFPERVNVGFMEVVNKNAIRLRVYERGSGETLACGTGACAAVVAGIQQGLLANEVEVQLAGGYLQIAWQPDGVVWMTGPTATVFEGSLSIEDAML